ncbi:hypothetical protein ACH3XW_0885 [Acanthocheilonema viteae]|uniref:Uncharacterized protein n=1 Tax=Acanthocheilonema viteae TaxID=6277 RepID=A0A498SUJ4_ACAVI|nr:unnamed protein product [Acanthocheilonema viteae]
MKSVLIPSFTLLFAFSMLITAVLLIGSDTENSTYVDEMDNSDGTNSSDDSNERESDAGEMESHDTERNEMESNEMVRDSDKWKSDFRNNSEISEHDDEIISLLYPAE